jgi:hypothetical protein
VRDLERLKWLLWHGNVDRALQLVESVDMDLDVAAALGDSRCLVPGCDGALYGDLPREALWDSYSTAAPARPRQCVARYRRVNTV